MCFDVSQNKCRCVCVCVRMCHGLGGLRATTHCISQECILPGFTTGEKKINDGSLIIRTYWRNPKSATHGSGKLRALIVKQVQLESNRLNAYLRLPLKEHDYRGRHGRCLPSESKQFNSMQPSLVRDWKRMRREFEKDTWIGSKSFDVQMAVIAPRCTKWGW